MKYKYLLSALLIVACYFVLKFALRSEDDGVAKLPRLVVTTDINIDSGDPDDRQSMVHLMYYLDELDVRAIIIDRPNAGGVKATEMVIEEYRKDYNNPDYNFRAMNFTHPDTIAKRVYTVEQAAEQGLIGRIADESEEPLYVAVWGQMKATHKALMNRPELADKLRVLTIATEVKSAFDTKESEFGIRNWNDEGGYREEIFNDSRFDKMWFVENNWGYNGMFEGRAPKLLLKELLNYGALGQHMTDAVKSYWWSNYFRAGDTPTITYFIENPRIEDPLSYNWGGYFVRPFPQQRPNYYIDAAEDSTWDYSNPAESWYEAKVEEEARCAEFVKRRVRMYDSFRRKLNVIYNK